MSKTNLMIVAVILVTVSFACKSVKSILPGNSVNKTPNVEFATPAPGLDVRVALDKTQNATNKIGKSGGSVSLTTGDGSKFTLDVPADALDSDTAITLTAVKSIDGAPLDTNMPAAVQFEPSGLFFKAIATLTIVPGKDIPIKQQLVFGYDGDGKDYHMMPVDRKSREIKVLMMHFSGAGVGSASDRAWAANLMVQANSASNRIWQKFGEYSQTVRLEVLLGKRSDDDANPEWWAKFEAALDDYDDQVIRKEIVAAELDCKHAKKAIEDLITNERTREISGLPELKDYKERYLKLLTIGENCAAPYQIVGGLDDWQTNTKVCDIMKPFTLTGIVTVKFSGGLSGTYEYGGGPFNANGKGSYTISLPEGPGKAGTMTGGGSGQITGRGKVYTGSGTEKYTLTPIEPCN